jgi:oligo-1,6-glucosidase
MTLPSTPWWRSAVIYQIYPMSFADSDGDGIGDLRGIIKRLDHLEALGVDVLWLSPVYPSPRDDNGYDVSDYCDVDPTFGTLSDLDELIAAVHERGMRFVMDVVFNHTSDEHPWFLESRSSADNPKRDWYWWRPPRPGTAPGAPGAEPTNWAAAFSGPAWEYDAATGEYYLHLFSRKQPDLNWENPQVRAAIHEVMRWWLARGVDGFRMDVINFVSKDPALPDAPPRPGEPYGSGEASYIDGPRIHDYLRELRREVLGARDDVVLIGEMPGTTVEHARRYTDPSRGELDMVVQFEHTELDHGPNGKWDPRPLDLRDLKTSLGRWQDGLAERGWNSLYLSNHDQPRPVSRFGSDGEHRVASAKALATLLHLHRGTPFVYQGEELGMANLPLAEPGALRDIESRNQHAYAVSIGIDPAGALDAIRPMARDHARSPMPWDASEQAGFTSGAPWSALHPDHVTVNAAAQYDDPDSVFNHYRRLIALRRNEPTVVHGDFQMLAPDDPQLYAYTRTWQDTSLLVVVNVSSEPAATSALDRTDWMDTEPVLASGGRKRTSGVPDTLEPWQARVLRRTLVTGS